SGAGAGDGGAFASVARCDGPRPGRSRPVRAFPPVPRRTGAVRRRPVGGGLAGPDGLLDPSSGGASGLPRDPLRRGRPRNTTLPVRRPGIRGGGRPPLRGNMKGTMERSGHDLIVIGGGSAGHAAASTAAELGLRCAVVESADELGGLCILR